MSARKTTNTVKEAVLAARKSQWGEASPSGRTHRWPNDEACLKTNTLDAVKAIDACLSTVPGRPVMVSNHSSDPAAVLSISILERMQRVPEKHRQALVASCHRKPPGDGKILWDQVVNVVHGAIGAYYPDAKYNDSWRMWPHRKDGDVDETKGVQQRGKAASEETEVMASKKKTSKKATAKKPAAASNGAKKAKRGGKPVGSKLLSPVKKDSQRGAVLQAALRKDGADPDELAKELKTTRSSVMSMLHDLNGRSGIGYAVADGRVRAELPKGCSSPWAEAKSA